MLNPVASSAKPTKRGFTAIEIVVSLAIVAVLSAIVVPQIMGRVRESRRSALSQTLFGLSQGIAEYKKAVTRYPSQLVLLTTKPTIASTDACGAALSAVNVNNWRGPYVSRQLLATGIAMGDGNISNTLRRIAGPPSYLLMDVTGVDRDVALFLEEELDAPPPAPADSLSGTIRFTPAAVGIHPPAPAGTVNLSYSLPISGC